MTATLILKNLSKEFSVPTESVQSIFDMLDAGLSAPFIGRFRRSRTGALSESQIRRIEYRRSELEELERRKGTILRTLERTIPADSSALEPVKNCLDRFELEDLFVPHRRPEPEVQLAMDRGLGALADLLVKPVPRAERTPDAGSDEDAQATSDAGDEGDAQGASTAPAADLSETPQAVTGAAAVAGDPQPTASEPGPIENAAEPVTEAAASEPTPEAAAPAESEASPGAAAPEEAAPEAAAPQAEAPQAEAPAETPAAPVGASAHVAGLPSQILITPELARLCAPFVNPDKGIHTESDALAGAVRILSDRLGRNAHLRGLVRRMMRKRGVLTVKPLSDSSKAGRHRSLMKLKQPLRQIQGHRLLALRQAQKERVLTTAVTLDPSIAVPKIRALLGKHTHPAYDSLLNEVARQALEQRLMPVVEADVRLELKERGDAEALRFLAQHLRQVLLTSAYGPYPVVGVDVNAKGDWTLAALDEGGTPVSFAKIETKGPEQLKTPAELGAEVAAFLADSRARVICLGHGKGPRQAVLKLRAALNAADLRQTVLIVNESGLSSYANSERARTELPERTVPERMAVSIGRRLQNPMAEILKVDPTHLGLGAEQGLVSKANVRRVFRDTIESCVAHVGCDVRTAPLSILQHVPGLDKATAKRLIEWRQDHSIESREQLLTEGILTEAQWASGIAFLRVPGSPQPLDATNLHPESYALARQLLESSGGSVEENLGRPGVTKGLRRASFDLDEWSWRDMMRELSQPGRDPRFILHLPQVLDPDTDPARLVKDRVVEGIITNVASFGTFVDIGLPQDAMIHISEVSERYVRDAREVRSIGETVRARILDATGPRISLSLKKVPPPERAPRPARSRGKRPERERVREESPNVRAAQTRRDGLAGSRSGGRGGRGGGPGGGRGPGQGRGGRDDRGGRDERVNLDSLNSEAKGAKYSPFANFFKKPESEKE